MERRNFIKNKEVIPDTHYFVYRNNRYPIKFDYFKYASNYFSEHQHEIEGTKIIKLLEPEMEKKIIISDETINDFINFVQCKKISLSKENAVSLNYLSTKYEVEKLQEITSEYIANHQSDVVLEILNQHQYETNFDTISYEQIISTNLLKYIKDDRLLTLNIPIIYRIIHQYLNVDHAEEEDKEKVIEFLFNCLDKFGREASILFDGIDLIHEKKGYDYLNRMINKYLQIFDFHYIQKTIVETLINKVDEIQSLQKELSNKNIENKKIKEENEIIKERIQNVEKENKILEEKLRQQNQYSTELEKQNLNLNQIKTKFEETIQTKDKEIQRKEEENNKIQEENKTLRENIEQQKIQHSQEFEKLMKQNEEIKNENKKQKEIIQEYERIQKSILIPFNEKEKLNGIIKYLTTRTGGNIHDNGTVEVTSNPHCPNFSPNNLLDDSKSFFQSSQSFDSWVCFDFKNMKIKITNYSIKSNGFIGHLKNWAIEISDDKKVWKRIDERKDCEDLKGNYFIGTFLVSQCEFSRYIRLVQTGETWDDFLPCFTTIEFFGYIKE